MGVHPYVGDLKFMLQDVTKLRHNILALAAESPIGPKPGPVCICVC